MNVVAPRSKYDPQYSISLQNVRAADALEGRLRGGLRPGLSKYNATAIVANTRIQCLSHTTVIANTAPATGGLGVREVKAFAIAGGTIKNFTASTITTTTASGSRTLSATAPFILDAELFGRIYVTDGISYKVIVGSNNTATDWTPTAGSLPGTDGTRVARLIEMWRSRIFLSGLPSDPHNWFFSAIGGPLDWDTAPAVTVATQAFAGGVGEVGKIPDVITAGCPYSDDFFLFFCDHSIYALSGDPMAGGGIDLVIEGIGGAFGRPWCKDPQGNLYFYSNRGGVYVISRPGAMPESLTRESIEPELDSVNLNTTFVRMAYDEQRHGFHLFLTPFSAGTTSHWYYDTRTKGWFKDVFADNDHNPMTTMVFDGDNPDDRIVLIGSEDGFVRQTDPAAQDDDGTAIESFVTLGPITESESGRPFVLSEVQANTDNDGDDIIFETMVGEDPESAEDDEDVTFAGEGTLAAGRSVTHNPRRRGHYAYIKVGDTSSASGWALESVRVRAQIVKSAKARQLF